MQNVPTRSVIKQPDRWFGLQTAFKGISNVIVVLQGPFTDTVIQDTITGQRRCLFSENPNRFDTERLLCLGHNRIHGSAEHHKCTTVSFSVLKRCTALQSIYSTYFISKLLLNIYYFNFIFVFQFELCLKCLYNCFYFNMLFWVEGFSCIF